MKPVEETIAEFAALHGALLGLAPADRWDVHEDVPPAFRPRALWKQTNTVIVLGLQVPLPMLETTPSIIYTTLYQTCNTELDQLAFQLCRILNGKGHASIFMPRDGYGDIRILVEEPTAAFSQVYAAKYAGLGTVGFNHTLLTPEYGPRVRFVSVFTTLKTQGGKMIEKDLCTRCLMCAKCCPTRAFEEDSLHFAGLMDKKACAMYHARLRDAHRFPCGVCIKVCPVGRDRELYKSGKPAKYLTDRDDEEHRAWKHCQKYGSKPLDGLNR